MNHRAWLWGVFTATCALAMVLLAPLRLVLDTFAADLPIAAREVSGSLWAGRLRGAHWSGMPLDTLDLRLRLLPLLYGQQHWVLAGDRIDATVIRGRASGLRNASGELDLAAWPAWPDAGLRLGLDNATVLFGDDGCEVAEGRLGLDLQLPVPVADDNAVAPAIRLDGRPSCAGADARVEFAPTGSLPAGIDMVAISVDIDPAGRYLARTTVRTDMPGIRLALQAQGFAEDTTALVRNDRGQLLR